MEGLSDKQHRAIPFLLAAPSIEAACRSARISKATVYGWLKSESFQAEIRAQRERVMNSAIEKLKAGVEKAVDTLIELLDCSKAEVRRGAAKDVIEFGLKGLELQEIESRLTALEDLSKLKGNGHDRH
ncbi:MAG: IS630 transposase-related protein [Candidatus Binatia bacterium]